MFEDIDSSFLALRTIGWIVLLIIFMTITFINSDKISNKKPLYIFTLLSWSSLVFLPYLINTDYGLGKIEDDEVYDEEEMIGISFQRTIPNTIITLIYFGFFVNAIVKKLGKTASNIQGSRTGSTAGENYKLLAKSLGNQFSTVVYMAIFLVLINVFSTGYIYFNCEDKNSSFMIRSIVMSQYNIVIITVLGVITYIASKQMN